MAEMIGTEIVRSMARPQKKRCNRDVVRNENRAYELQTSFLAEAEGSQNQTSSNFGKQTEIDKFQELENSERKGPVSPVDNR